MAQKTGQNAIKYSIITAFSKKGLDAAEKGLAKLRKSFHKTSLANKLTFAAIGAGVTALAAKAFAAGKEQDRLNKQLQFTLNNLGYTTAIPSVNRFIDTLQRQTAVADNQLIPSFISLVRVTSQLTDAYDALQLALDINAITGDDVTTIAEAMAKGFAGNATALSKMIPGLDKASVKAADMTSIMKQLNAQFGGAAANNLTSFAGKLSLLKISFNKMLENIGKGIIDFLQGMTNTTSITDLGKAIEDFGTKVGDIMRSLPIVFKETFAKIEANMKQSWIGRLFLGLVKDAVKGLEIGLTKAAQQGKYLRWMKEFDWGVDLWTVKNTKKWSKTVNDTIKTITKVDWKSKLAGMFDLNAIALAAAKRNGILDKEQQARVEALQALNTDQLTDDEIYFKKLLGLSAEATKQLIADQNTVAANLKTQLDSQLKAYQDMYDAMTSKAQYATANINGKAVTAPSDLLMGLGTAATAFNPQINPLPSANTAFGDVPMTGGIASSYAGSNALALGGQTVNVTINAGAIGNEQFLVSEVGKAVTQYTRLGNVTAPAGFI